jgi:nucleoside diphosphate kinase
LNKKRQKEKNEEKLKQLDKESAKKPITICIIKPDMIANGKKDEIIQKITERHYKIVEERTVRFSEQMAKEFYKHKSESVSI